MPSGNYCSGVAAGQIFLVTAIKSVPQRWTSAPRPPLRELEIRIPKTNLNITESDDVASLDLARLAVGDPASIDKSAIGRTRVGDQQRSLLVYQQRRMNLGNAGVVQTQFVVGHAANV